MCVQSTVCVSVRACVRARLTPFSANTMLRVVMYISCFVGPRRASSFSSHQTFMPQKRIYISRDPAQPNLLGASTSPSPSRYHSRRMFHVLVCLFSSRPSPPSSPSTHPPFCSNPLLLKASLSFRLCSLFILSLIALKKGGKAKNGTNGPL